MKLVHLVGFIIKKFVTIHGHMNVKQNWNEVVLAKLMTVQPEVNSFNPYQIPRHLDLQSAVPFNISAANP